MLLAFMSPLSGNIRADEQEARRVAVGINVFPAFLAADRDIVNKRSPGGQLLLLLVHADQPGSAAKLAAGLSDKGSIRGIPLKVEIVTLERLREYEDTKVAGIFITQRMGDDVETLIEFSRDNQTLTFSPFEGDVERGVLGGIVVSDRVLPYINLSAMDAFGIRIKPFFLRIAEHYEKP